MIDTNNILKESKNKAALAKTWEQWLAPGSL
jgi:hypothetical protein